MCESPQPDSRCLLYLCLDCWCSSGSSSCCSCSAFSVHGSLSSLSCHVLFVHLHRAPLCIADLLSRGHRCFRPAEHFEINLHSVSLLVCLQSPSFLSTHDSICCAVILAQSSASFASSYTLSGCKDAAYCGVFRRVSAHCDQHNEIWSCCPGDKDARYGWTDATQCDAAPVYTRDDGHGSLSVLFRDSSGSRSLWYVGHGYALSTCSVYQATRNPVNSYQSYCYNSKFSDSDSEPSSPDAASYGWSEPGGYASGSGYAGLQEFRSTTPPAVAPPPWRTIARALHEPWAPPASRYVIRDPKQLHKSTGGRRSRPKSQILVIARAKTRCSPTRDLASEKAESTKRSVRGCSRHQGQLGMSARRTLRFLGLGEAIHTEGVASSANGAFLWRGWGRRGCLRCGVRIKFHPPKLVSDYIKEEHKFGGWKPDGETGEAGGRTVVREVWVGRGCVPLYLH
eukprot:COSAG03_NODE_7_length_25331_cov_113.442375_9_plen_453_part_00